MGNCATKPKVLKDSDEDLVPVEQETTSPTDHDKDPAYKSKNIAPNAVDEAAARRSEKGKQILIEDDVDEHNNKRPPVSPLFRENKTIEKEVTDLSPTKPEVNNKTGAFSEVSKLDTSALMASNVKAQEPFNVQTRNDLEVKITKDSKVKTPETPKAKEAEEHEVNWNVKVANESKFPEVSAPELSEVKIIKESNVPEDLEDKNISEVSNVKTDKVKAAESELLKVSEVKSSEDLEIKVPKIFEVKTPETSNVKEESEVKTDQEASKVKIADETEVSEFVDAQEKIDKSDQDKKVMLSKTK